PTIFIAGDASDQAALLHEAADQGRIAGDNAGRFPEITGGLRRSHLAVVFCDPQIAVVGESYAGLCARLGDDRFAIGEVDFSGQGRARTVLRNSGLLRVYADRKSGRFLGAEMVAPDGEHLGHLLAWAHQQELTVGEILDLPFYHPVVEEGLRTALQQVAAELAGKAG
ncbi:MAG: dihydrolipoamide dehydrogenase, partial [Chloroflexi bacterium]